MIVKGVIRLFSVCLVENCCHFPSFSGYGAANQHSTINSAGNENGIWIICPKQKKGSKTSQGGAVRQRSASLGAWAPHRILASSEEQAATKSRAAKAKFKAQQPEELYHTLPQQWGQTQML